jgi:hypothetical protein
MTDKPTRSTSDRDERRATLEISGGAVFIFAVALLALILSGCAAPGDQLDPAEGVKDGKGEIIFKPTTRAEESVAACYLATGYSEIKYAAALILDADAAAGLTGPLEVVRKALDELKAAENAAWQKTEGRYALIRIAAAISDTVQEDIAKIIALGITTSIYHDFVAPAAVKAAIGHAFAEDVAEQVREFRAGAATVDGLYSTCLDRLDVIVNRMRRLAGLPEIVIGGDDGGS